MVKGKMYNIPGATKPNSKGKAQDSGPVRQIIAQNKKARHDYLIEDVFEAGMVLGGTEVKALRAGRASLVDGWVYIDNGEAWLEGAHKSEIARLHQKTTEKGLTIVPLQMYWLDGRAKVEIALARGKKEYDKRHALREKQDNREALRAMRLREKM
jgi:SsrA-binding protein